jgi:V-type H+-transporting ATPase subunit a
VNNFQRSFVGEIRRIDEMARRVRFFAAQVQKNNIPVRPLFDSVPLTITGPRVQQIRDELDVKLSEHETRVLQMNESYETLSARRRELIEARHVLRETSVFFDRVCAACFYSELVTDAQQAQTRQTDIRQSFDDGTQPLLAADDHENQLAGGGFQFDLEYVPFSPFPCAELNFG